MDLTKLRRKMNPDSRLGGDPGIELRTGTVTAVGNGTATITLGGASVPGVPVLDNAVIAVGSVVQVISYRGSLLIIGVSAKGLMTRVKASDGTNVGPFTDTSPVAGSPAVSLVFVAPGSGSVTMTIHAALTGASGQAFLTGRVRTGGTPGSGTLVYDGSVEPEPRLGISSSTINASVVCAVDGLTPGSTYNAQVVHWTASGGANTGTVFSRHMSITPL